MKAYLFIETGEVRCPKKGEWFISDTRRPMFSGTGYKFGDRTILVRHEIEMPEGTKGISISQWDTGYRKFPEPCLYNIPIPYPKKKVKKYQWLYKEGDRVKLTFHKYQHEGEIRNIIGSRCSGVLYPVPETEIEEEE